MSDLINRDAAIEALRYAQHRFTVADEAGGMGTVKWSEDVIYFDAAVNVLSSLPTTQPEPCEYCNEDPDGYVKPIEKNNHAFIRFGASGWELSLRAKGWSGSAKIKYCPMCGRNLSIQSERKENDER